MKSMGGRGKRKFPINKVKAKELKGILKDCKNSIEQKRVQIMIVYLGGKDTNTTAKILGVSKDTVQKTLAKYEKDQNEFYKTNYKGRIETEERKNLKKEVKDLVEKKINKGEHCDIMEVEKSINKKHGKSVLDYYDARWILRKRFGYNYQKGFIRNRKQPENAKEIFKERLTEAIIQIGIKENEIDANAIKNKKTKIGEYTS